MKKIFFFFCYDRARVLCSISRSLYNASRRLSKKNHDTITKPYSPIYSPHFGLPIVFSGNRIIVSFWRCYQVATFRVTSVVTVFVGPRTWQLSIVTRGRRANACFTKKIKLPFSMVVASCSRAYRNNRSGWEKK